MNVYFVMSWPPPGDESGSQTMDALSLSPVKIGSSTAAAVQVAAAHIFLIPNIIVIQVA